MKTINDYTIYQIRGKYVIHFLSVVSPDHAKDGLNAVNNAYNKALGIAKDFGGKKFHNKAFGGGISFNSVEAINKAIQVGELNRVLLG